MGMTKGEKDDIRQLVKDIIQKRLNEITSSLQFKAAVDASSEGLTEELVGEKLAGLLQNLDKATKAVQSAEKRERTAKDTLQKAIREFLDELEETEPDNPLIVYWADANGRSTWGNRQLQNKTIDGLQRVLKHAAKERAAKAAEFGDVAKLRALHENIEMLVLTATSNAQINKVIQGMYRKFATANDQISMELVSEMFPFLFFDEE